MSAQLITCHTLTRVRRPRRPRVVWHVFAGPDRLKGDKGDFIFDTSVVTRSARPFAAPRPSREHVFLHVFLRVHRHILQPPLVSFVLQ